MPAPGAALRVRNVSKTFGHQLALTAVNLDIASGEMVALIGPSGSGKSTLLRAIAGLVLIDAGVGRVEVLGRPIQQDGRLNAQARGARRAVGLIFQQFNLVGRLSLYTNVALGSLGRIGLWRGLTGWWPAEVRIAAMAAMARVGVAEYAGQRAKTLSGGQQQRAAIARALVQKAPIILADEPVASLDPVSARQVMDILRELNTADRLTVVVSLHHAAHALRYCDRAIALKAGTIVYDGPISGLARERLIDIYGPRFEDADWQGALT
ncbi:MAG TPA: phosphonate ABC transporter ATP-binding protein [Caulobacteraceae bacterium]